MKQKILITVLTIAVIVSVVFATAGNAQEVSEFNNLYSLNEEHPVASFFALAGLSGSHQAELPDGGSIIISENGAIQCVDGFASCTPEAAMIMALTTDGSGILNLSWYAYSVQFQVVNGQVTATYCEVTMEKNCTQADYTSIPFK